MSLYVEGILIVVGINILLALGYWITVNTGQFSFGHAAFMAIGAYVASIMTVKFGLALVPALVAGGLAAGTIGALVGFPALRLSMLYLAMATLGFAQLTQIFFLNWDFVGRASGMTGMRGATLPLVVGTVLIVIGYLWLVSRPRVGLACAAVREDEAAARASGLNVTQLKVIAFGQGAFVTGLAGGLYAHQILHIEPANFGVQQSLVIVLYVMFGGLSTFWGPLIGAGLLTVLPEWFDFLRDWYLIVYGALFVLLMIVRPQGLISGGTWWRRRSASLPSAADPAR
ncbi:MAG: branched-chain amino acid ABC transporter permease [Chloroflexota bacterium]